MAEFDDDIMTLEWDAIAFRSGGDHFTFHLPHPAFEPELNSLNARIGKARNVSELR